MRQQLRLGDFRDHVGKLRLHELVSGDGLIVKLFAHFGIFQRLVVTGHGGTDGSPADAIARLSQAA